MTRIGYLADVHAANHAVMGGVYRGGLNDRARSVLSALRSAAHEARTRGCDKLVILGDLFDTHTPSPQLVAATYHALSAFDPRDIMVLRGNHDARTDAPGDDALVVLDRLAGIRTYPEPPYVTRNTAGGLLEEHSPSPGVISWESVNADVAMFLAPHCAAASMRAVVMRAAEESAKMSAAGGRAWTPRRHALAFHAGLQHADTPEFLRSDTSTVLLSELEDVVNTRAHALRAVFCGDWHEHFHHIFDPSGIGHEPHLTHFVQVGSLCPTGFEEPGFGFHGLVIWDISSATNRIEKVRIAGPRFLKAHVADEAFTELVWGALGSGDATEVYASFHPRTAQEHAQCTAALADGSDLRTALTAYRIVPDERAAQDRAQARAVTARKATSFEEALRVYVGSLSLPDGVTHDEVLHRVRAHLAG